MKPLKALQGMAIGAILMFILSYSWHGMLLNDLKFIKYDLKTFLGLLGLAYLLIAALLSLLLLAYQPEEQKVVKHFLISASSGVILYAIVWLSGSSLSGRDLTNDLVNLCWQILEQGMGGLVISVYYSFSKKKNSQLSFPD